MKIAFDMSAFMWRALLAGKDTEWGREVEHEGKTVYVNSAAYGYEIVMEMMVKSVLNPLRGVPIDCILVFEGQSSKKKRQAIDPMYKASRDTRPPQAYEEFHKLRELLDRTWRDLGAITMMQDFCEGDDVLAFLAQNVEEDLLIATYDNDLAPLNFVNDYGAKVQVWVDGAIGENNKGSWPHSLVRLYKTLVGKSGEMPGCVGFGEKSFEDLLVKYGEDGAQDLLDMMEAGSLDELHAIADEQKCKVLQKICTQDEHVLKQYKLAKLHPEWVNTLMHPLQIKPGKVAPMPVNADSRIKDWYGLQWLITADNYEQIVPWVLSQFHVSPFVALDIETSTPVESDDWLAALEDPDGVDVLGSKLTGLSLTFGPNMQFTIYFSVDHRDTNNVTSEQVRQVVAAIPSDKLDTVIHNLNFELPVLHQEWSEHQMDNGFHGFLPACLDTKLEASYVNENEKLGLKQRSLLHLGYQQTSYAETTQKSGKIEEKVFLDELGNEVVEYLRLTLPSGGRRLKVFDQCVKPAVVETYDEPDPDRPGAVFVREREIEPALYEKWETRQYKMNELTAAEVFNYGCDDTICTAALHNYFKLVMQLEHTWKVYLKTEIGAAYLTAAGFLQGTDISVEKVNTLRREDMEVKAKAWAVLRDFLIAKGWEGTRCPTYALPMTPALIKEAYEIVTGRRLETQIRKLEKLVIFIREQGEETFAELLNDALTTLNWQRFNDYVKQHFKGEPQINLGSPKQLQKLLYETLGLPIVMRNKPTEKMRAAGIKEGSAKTDVLAMDWALKYDVEGKPEVKAVLESIKLINMVDTREELYYHPYPLLMHWMDGKIHSSTNQCQTNTRRASESNPNKQQLPKNMKIEGQPPRFREAIVPHLPDAVIVSMDFESQELVIIADYSRDPNMVACFVGDNKKKMHTLTALGIAQRKYKDFEWSYEVFEEIRNNQKEHPRYFEVKQAYADGKKVNFTTEYGAMAEKVGQTLLISTEEAQSFIDAKEEAFPVARAWKDSVIEELKSKGYVTTKDGARRHLRDALMGDDAWERSKAERQGVNFKVQGTAAEQTKQSMTEMWRRELIFKYDCVFIGPIHDEVVWSCKISDLYGFIPDLHACMVRPYGGMTIPITSSISFGPDFGRQIEIGNQPTREAIDYGLKKLNEMLAEEMQEAA